MDYKEIINVEITSTRYCIKMEVQFRSSVNYFAGVQISKPLKNPVTKAGWFVDMV
jgi:hypothetical protein